VLGSGKVAQLSKSQPTGRLDGRLAAHIHPVQVEPSRLMILMLIWAIALYFGAAFGSRSLIALTIVIVIFGFTGAMGNIELNTYLMASADESMLGRVFSIRQLFSFGAYTAGPMLGGLLAGYDLSNGVCILFYLALGTGIVSSGAFMWSCRQPSTRFRLFLRPPPLERPPVSSPAASLNQRTNDSEGGRVPAGAVLRS
jgi:MFS family permease